MLGFSEIRILHGKGTGALKEEIRNYLRAVDLVKSARDEHEELGRAGITVVKLDYRLNFTGSGRRPGGRRGCFRFAVHSY